MRRQVTVVEHCWNEFEPGERVWPTSPRFPLPYRDEGYVVEKFYPPYVALGELCGTVFLEGYPHGFSAEYLWDHPRTTETP